MEVTISLSESLAFRLQPGEPRTFLDDSGTLFKKLPLVVVQEQKSI